MANLTLDVTVTGAKKSEKEIYKVGKAGESVEKTFKRLGTSQFLKGLPVTVKKMNEAFVKTQTKAKELLRTLEGYGGSGFKELIKDEKTVLKLTNKLNDEFEKQAKLQAKLAQKGRGTPQQNALAKQLKIMKKQTAELQKQAGVHKRNTKEVRKQVGLLARIKGSGIGKAVIGGAGFAVGALGLVGLVSTVQRLIDLWKRFTIAVGESFYTINSEAQQSRILLSTALGDESAGAKMFEEVLTMATQMPFSIKAISDSFVKLQTAGIDKAGEKVTILADAISAFGGTDEDLRLATIAIQQMAGKGVAAMEELRRQLGERVPTAIRGMAREMGITYLELVDKVSTGTLLFDEKAQGALFRGLQEHAGAAEKRMDSMLGAVKLLQTAWQRFMIDIGDSKGSFSSLSKIVKAVADALDTFRTSTEGRKVIDDISEAIINLVEKVTPEAIYGAFKLIEEVARFTLEVVKTAVSLGLGLLDKLAKAGNVPEKWGGVQRIREKLGRESGRTKNIFGVEVDIDGLTNGLDSIRTRLSDFNSSITQEKDVFGLGTAMEGSIDELDHALGLWEPNIKNLTMAGERIKSEIGNIDKEILDLQDTIVKIGKDFGKVITTNEREELKFAVKFGLGDGPGLKDQIKEIDAAIQQTNVNDKKGREEVLALLRRQRDLIREMSTDAEKVTKGDVARAKATLININQLTRGGKAAGTRETYTAALQQYLRLRVLEKEGLADDRKEKKLAQEKFDLLQKNTDLTRQTQQRAVTPARTEVQRLAEEADLKTEIHKQTLAQVEELKKAKEGSDEIKRLEEEAAAQNKNHKSTMSDVEALKKAEKDAHVERMGFLDRQLEKVKEIYEYMKKWASTPASGPGGIAPRALGGPVKKDELYLVGEKGPEMFVPDSSGTIIPNDQMFPEKREIAAAMPKLELIKLEFDISAESFKKVIDTTKEIGKAAFDAVKESIVIDNFALPEPEADLGPYQKILDEAKEILSAPFEASPTVTVAPEFKVNTGHRLAHLDIQMEEALEAYKDKPVTVKKEVEVIEKVTQVKEFGGMSLPSPGGKGRDHGIPEGLGDIYKLDDGSFTNQTKEQREAFEKLGETIRGAGEAKQEYSRIKVDNYFDHDPGGGEGVWRNYILEAEKAKTVTKEVYAERSAHAIADKQLDNLFDSSEYKTAPGETMVQEVQAKLDIKPSVPIDTRAKYDEIVREEERKMSEAMANFKPYQIDPATAKELDFLQFGEIDKDLAGVFDEIDTAKPREEIKKLASTRADLDTLNDSLKNLAKDSGDDRRATAIEKATKAHQKEKQALAEKEQLLKQEQERAANLPEVDQKAVQAIEEKKQAEGSASGQAQKNAQDLAVKESGQIKLVGELTEARLKELGIMKEQSQVNPYASVGGGSTDFSPTSYPGRYAGGPVIKDQPYIVGERGPELFVPSNSGAIVPNNQLGGSGDTTEVYFNFNKKRIGPFNGSRQLAKEVLKEIEIMQGALS